MKKIITWITDHPKQVVWLYVLLVGVSLFGISKVDIEYDLSAYLPKDMTSYRGKVLLEEEFQMGGLASLLIKEEDEKVLGQLSTQIGAVEGVKEVLYFPGNSKDGYSLIDLVFEKGSSTKETQQAINNTEDLLEGREYYLGGESSIAKAMQDITSREIVLYSLIAFVVIGIILLLGSNTYHEPLYFFIAIGVAIALNMGTNVIFGKISSNTNSVVSILQLAVSMDYSIFLLHRYYEEKKRLPAKEAMQKAVFKSMTTISASALTTIGGFLALVVMKYGIGKDMGLVLAKGVFFSLICVMTLLPSLILLIDHYFKDKRHKIWIPSLGRWAGKLVGMRYIILVLIAVIALPVFWGQTQVKYYYSNEKTLKDSATAIASTKKIQEVYGVNNQLVVITPLSEKDKLKNVMNRLKGIEGVKGAMGLYSVVSDKLPVELIPKEIVDKFQSDEYTYFAVTLDRPLEGEETSDTLAKIKEVLQSDLGESYFLTGEAVVYDDLKTVTKEDFGLVTWVSIMIVGIILALAFKSISLPIILIFIIQLGIWINLSIPYFMGEELNFISFIILGAIQLGATVDYAILFTSRYKERLAGEKVLEALKGTIRDTSRAVMTSALILIAGTLSVYCVTTIRSASELTLLIARGAVISVVLVYIALPALLYIAEPVIRKTTKGWPSKKER